MIPGSPCKQRCPSRGRYGVERWRSARFTGTIAQVVKTEADSDSSESNSPPRIGGRFRQRRSKRAPVRAWVGFQAHYCSAHFLLARLGNSTPHGITRAFVCMCVLFL